MESKTTFKASIEEFVSASPWLGATHAPALASLRALASELDRDVTAALVAQFGLTYRNLAKEAPVEDEGDDLERALSEAAA